MGKPKPRRAYWEEESNDWTPHSGIGSGHSVSVNEPEYDPVAELHKVVEEVTGKPVAAKKHRFGFM